MGSSSELVVDVRSVRLITYTRRPRANTAIVQFKTKRRPRPGGCPTHQANASAPLKVRYRLTVANNPFVSFPSCASRICSRRRMFKPKLDHRERAIRTITTFTDRGFPRVRRWTILPFFYHHDLLYTCTLHLGNSSFTSSLSFPSRIPLDLTNQRSQSRIIDRLSSACVLPP
jgi:hypothetical protein